MINPDKKEKIYFKNNAIQAGIIADEVKLLYYENGDAYCDFEIKIPRLDLPPKTKAEPEYFRVKFRGQLAVSLIEAGAKRGLFLEVIGLPRNSKGKDKRKYSYLQVYEFELKAKTECSEGAA